MDRVNLPVGIVGRLARPAAALALIASLVVALGMPGGSPAAAATYAPRYSLTDLGTLSGSSSGLALNASGDATGDSTNASNLQRAFLVSGGGAMQDLGSLSAAGYDSSRGTGINGTDEVVGFTMQSSQGGYPPSRAFLWKSGTMFDLSLGDSSQAYGVNDLGQVAATIDNTNTFSNTATLWTPSSPNGTTGSAVSLGDLGGGWAAAYAINNDGQVVGESYPTSPFTSPYAHAFLWTPNSPNGTAGSMKDLGTATGQGSSQAFGVSNDGKVTGDTDTNSGAGADAFLWTPTTPNGTTGSMLDLGNLGSSSYGQGVNDAGQVVGYSFLSGGAQHGFLWQNGTMYDLNNLIVGGSSWVITQAYGINDSGQIIATAFNPTTDAQHAVLLTPVPPAATSLDVSPATGPYGGSVTLSATLTASGNGVSTEQIDFTLNGTSVGSANTDTNGVATLSGVSLAGLSASQYPGAIGASFSGDAAYAASSGTADLTVTQATPTISWTPSPTTFPFGTPLGSGQLDATAGVPGSFSYSYSGTSDAGTPVSGTAAVGTVLSAGSYTLTATFTPADATDHTGTSAQAGLNVTPDATTTSPDNAAATYGNASTVTLSASVTDGGVTVDGGMVTFTVTDTGNNQVGGQVSMPVSGGSASAGFTVPANTPAGGYTITATYHDAAGNFVDSSGTSTLTVAPAATTTTVGPASVTVGAAGVTLSASVGSSVPVTEGTVTFTVSDAADNPVGSPVVMNVANGQANASYPLPTGLAAGSYTITAAYRDLAGNFADSHGTGTLTVSYAVCVISAVGNGRGANSVAPIKLELCDAKGHDVSSSNVTLHAVEAVSQATGTHFTVHTPGNANPNNDFRYDPTLGSSGGYILNLKRSGMPAGSYTLELTVGGSTALVGITFTLR